MELADQRPTGLEDPLRQGGVGGWVAEIETRGADAEGGRPAGQRAFVARGIDAEGESAGDGEARAAQAAGELPCGAAAQGGRATAADDGDLGCRQHGWVASDEQQPRHPGERQQLRWITRIDGAQQLQVEAFYGARRRFDGRRGVMDEEARRRGPPTECDEIGFAELGRGPQAAGRRHRSP